MSNRTILASFLSSHDANLAADKIHNLGIEIAKVDELQGSGGEPDLHSYLISGEIPSLAAITLDKQPLSRDVGVLLAADPSASGMSDGRDNITGRNFLLTVVCREDLVEPVVKIIKDCNGYT